MRATSESHVHVGKCSKARRSHDAIDRFGENHANDETTLFDDKKTQESVDNEKRSVLEKVHVQLCEKKVKLLAFAGKDYERAL